GQRTRGQVPPLVVTVHTLLRETPQRRDSALLPRRPAILEPRVPEAGVPAPAWLQAERIQRHLAGHGVERRQRGRRGLLARRVPRRQSRLPERREHTERIAIPRRQLPRFVQQVAVVGLRAEALAVQRATDAAVALLDRRLVAAVPEGRCRAR